MTRSSASTSASKDFRNRRKAQREEEEYQEKKDDLEHRIRNLMRACKTMNEDSKAWNKFAGWTQIFRMIGDGIKSKRSTSDGPAGERSTTRNDHDVGGKGGASGAGGADEDDNKAVGDNDLATTTALDDAPSEEVMRLVRKTRPLHARATVMEPPELHFDLPVDELMTLFKRVKVLLAILLDPALGEHRDNPVRVCQLLQKAPKMNMFAAEAKKQMTGGDEGNGNGHCPEASGLSPRPDTDDDSMSVASTNGSEMTKVYVEDYDTDDSCEDVGRMEDVVGPANSTFADEDEEDEDNRSLIDLEAGMSRPLLVHSTAAASADVTPPTRKSSDERERKRTESTQHAMDNKLKTTAPPTPASKATALNFKNKNYGGTDTVYFYIVKTSVEHLFRACQDLILLCAEWRITYQLNNLFFRKKGYPAHIAPGQMWRLSFWLMHLSLIVREVIYYIQEVIAFLVPDEMERVRATLLAEFHQLLLEVERCHDVSAEVEQQEIDVVESGVVDQAGFRGGLGAGGESRDEDVVVGGGEGQGEQGPGGRSYGYGLGTIAEKDGVASIGLRGPGTGARRGASGRT
eukprot:g2545.t1